jgi:putative DNA primase/helicase
VTLQPIARAHHANGLSLVPVTTDGSKIPATTWKTYQTQRATLEQITTWFGPHQALGVVCGQVSGNLEMIELEGRAVDEGLLEQLVTALADHGYGHVWDRLKAGWVEVSPGGGFHWFYRVDGPALGNTKLARRPATPAELEANPAERIKVLIETRGEGGFVVLAPSSGHDSGKPWTLVSNQPIPVISSDERDALYAIAQTLDRMPVATPPPAATRHLGPVEADGERPGDDYNNRADWADLLLPLGWTHVDTYGKTRTWRRPGKNNGISATTGRNDGDNLYVFSTSTEFDDQTPYSKFHAYTHLHHNGDWQAAAKALRSQGYGKPLEPTRPTGPVSAITGLPVTDGNLATVHHLAPRVEVVSDNTLQHSDDANALALVETYGDRIRYCHDRGRWLHWDGRRWLWCEQGGGKIREYAKDIARALPSDDKAEALHKKRSLGAIGTTAMLTQAHTDPRISVSLADLDAHAYELNTPGGIVDLRTGTLQPADPSRLHTRMTTCTPDPSADPGRWAEFLTDTFGDNTALIAFLQRMVGYSAIGKVGPHVLPFCHGSGGNGKGVLLETVTKVLGDYATTTPSGFLMKQLHAKHETEIARLAGARMVLCSEVNEDDQFDEAKVKLLTGGDSLTARFMGRDHFTFTPTHQLWLMGNYQPAVRSGGRAFWRRLRLIGFDREVPVEKMVDDLQGILAGAHGPAVLNWIIAGAVEYHRAGLQEPGTVLAATATYAHDQDTVARFLEEQCEVSGSAGVQLKVGIVREAYEAWCRENGETAVTAKAFGLAMQKRGIEAVKGSKGQRFYRGMCLLGGEENSGWGHDSD